MERKGINILCEGCNREYTTAEVGFSLEGNTFVGGYCDRCSEDYQIKNYGKIVE